MKLRQILVASDLSPASFKALDVARQLARADNATLTVVCANDVAPAGGWPVTLSWPIEADFDGQFERCVTETLSKRSDGWSVPVEIAVIAGHPARAIVDHAEVIDADLIVLAAESAPIHGGLSPTTARVCRYANRPVLVVPADIPTLDGEWRIRRILAPVDFEEPADAGLRSGLALAARFDAELHVGTVVAVPRGMGLLAAQEYAVSLPEITTRLLDDVQDAVTARCVDAGADSARVHVIGAERPADAIVALAKELTADLIVIPSLGKGWLARMFLGSTTERILHHAPCPVWVIPRRSKGNVEGEDKAA